MKKMIFIGAFTCLISLMFFVRIGIDNYSRKDSNVDILNVKIDKIDINPIIKANAKGIENIIDEIKDTKKDEKIDYDNIIYIGDSRFVGMKNVADDELFIAKVSMGYTYFLENLDLIKNSYTENDIIIVGFGVNDLYNIDKYIELANNLAEEYNIAYLSINPVDEEIAQKRGYIVSNKEIDDFNEKLRKNLDEKVFYVDSNTYLKEIGFNTSDGLHYDSETYKKIYEYINDILK